MKSKKNLNLVSIISYVNDKNNFKIRHILLFGRNKTDESNTLVAHNIFLVPFRNHRVFFFSFAQADLPPTLGNNVAKAGYKKPTPVQKRAIPCALNGRDIMACAQTGSGKTVRTLVFIWGSIFLSKRTRHLSYILTVFININNVLSVQDIRKLKTRQGFSK